eukprot:COSAG02_NODE_12034_length_1609_cov_2.266887_1_plen_331_part_00
MHLTHGDPVLIYDSTEYAYILDDSNINGRGLSVVQYSNCMKCHTGTYEFYEQCTQLYTLEYCVHSSSHNFCKSIILARSIDSTERTIVQYRSTIHSSGCGPVVCPLLLAAERGREARTPAVRYLVRATPRTERDRMFKRKKAKSADIAEAASVAELGLDFSESSSEEENDEEGGGDPSTPAVPRESVAATPALWSGHLAFCGALPLSTWPSGKPQRRGPLTVKCVCITRRPSNANALTVTAWCVGLTAPHATGAQQDGSLSPARLSRCTKTPAWLGNPRRLSWVTGQFFLGQARSRIATCVFPLQLAVWSCTFGQPNFSRLCFLRRTKRR